jgi:polygalacturonase
MSAQPSAPRRCLAALCAFAAVAGGPLANQPSRAAAASSDPSWDSFRTAAPAVDSDRDADRGLKRYPITDAGAVGDGRTLNTAAIQRAIDGCAADGGGVLVVPRGVFLTGAIFLRPGVSLRVEPDGVLKGSDQLRDYLPAGASETQRGLEPFALVNAQGLTGLTLSGGGTIDGSGARWWAEYWKLRGAKDPDLAFKTRRPKLVHLTSCSQVLVSGLTLENQAVWCLDLQLCQDVVAKDLTIRAGRTAPSSDGIDVDSCRRVRISRCSIEVDDDCISIKAGHRGAEPYQPCEQVIVEQTHFGYGQGGVAIGSETFGSIRHVEVRDCTADNGNWAPVRFKTAPSRGGVVEDIVYRHFRIDRVRQAFEINMDWRSGTGRPETPAKVLPVFRDIRLIDVTGSAASAGVIRGLDGSPVTGVTFTGCKITAQKGLVVDRANAVDLSGLAIDLQPAKPVSANPPTTP